MEFPTDTPTLAALVAVAVCLAWAMLQRWLLSPLRVLRRLRAQGVPGLPFRPLVGNIPEIISLEARRDSDPAIAASTRGYQFSHDGTAKFGSVWTFSFGPVPSVMLTDPALVRQFLSTQSENFGKSAISKKITLVGNGLIVSEGALWTRQRRIINPAFQMSELRRLFATLVECTEEAIGRWTAAAEQDPGTPLAMDVELSQLTLDIIMRTAFGVGLQGSTRREIQAAFSEYLFTLPQAQMFGMIFPPYSYLPTPKNLRMWQAERTIRGAVKGIVAKRLESIRTNTFAKKQPRTDLLQLMIDATEGVDGDQTSQARESKHGGVSNGGRHEVSGSEGARKSGQGGEKNHQSSMSQQQLIDECITFLGGGSETSAVLLTWTMLLLSQHKEWQDKAREEVMAFSSDPKWAPDFETLSQMRVVHCIVQETLRLMPPFSLHLRTCVRDTELKDGLVIPAGCDVFASIEVIHVREDLWGPDSATFNPQRFAAGVNSAASQPGAFIPFGLGPRVCIGQNFAMMEAKLVLAMMLRRFSWRVDPSYRHHPVMTISTKPKHGLPVILEPL